LANGSLEIDGRRFVLRGTGTEIPFPRPAIRIQPGVTASAQQGQLRIEFAEPSRAAGSGTLSVEFRSGVKGVAADPAIVFLPLSPPSQFAQFTVKEGDTRAPASATATTSPSRPAPPPARWSLPRAWATRPSN
jgi:hypothetical protein